MSHNLFGEKFFSNREIPWHRLGTVSEEEHTAIEALEIVGDYRVEAEGLRTVESGLLIADRAIIRFPTKEDPEYRYFGSVGPEYVLVTPRDACEIWDMSVKRPVETLGALGSGETFFLTTKLPSIDIRGDEVDTYMLLVSPMLQGQSVEIVVSPVRVVCQNTLTAAKGLATEHYKIRHDSQVLNAMGEWLEGVYDRAVEKTGAIKEVFEIFAGKQATEDDVKYVLEHTYPVPNKPKRNAPDNVMEQRMLWWEEGKEQIMRFRGSVMDLFEGNATGFEGSDLRGTPWHLYNCVVEWEDWRDSRGRLMSQAEKVLFGDRAEAKERAFNATFEICNN